jgi:hypothetical protein
MLHETDNEHIRAPILKRDPVTVRLTGRSRDKDPIGKDVVPLQANTCTGLFETPKDQPLDESSVISSTTRVNHYRGSILPASCCCEKAQRGAIAQVEDR